MTTDRIANPPTTNDNDGDVGGDLKYGVTANLTADLTVNTDFAQVEIDEQQVNLTRFNLFLPEKREFFLEGRGLFDFGRGGASGGGGGGIPGGGFGGSSDVPYMFYSRRIGLNRSRVVPIDVGGRLTGKVGAWGVGVLNIQTGDETASSSPSTNFTVARIKRDILRRSTIGAMFTNRNQSELESARQQSGLRRRRGVRLLSEHRARRVLRAHRNDQPHRRQRELPGQVRLGAGSLWRPRRSLESRQGLQSGSRLPAPHGFHALVCVGALQPAAEEHARGPQVHLSGGQLRVFRERRRRGRIAAADRPRSTSSSTTATSSTSRRTPITTCWSRRSRRRRDVTIPIGGYHYNDVLCRYNMGQQRRLSGTHRPAARRVLQRHDHGADVLAGPLRDPQAVLGRAAVLDQPHRAADRQLHADDSSAPAPTTAFRRACSPARCCNTRPPTAPSAATCDSGGNIGPGSEFFVVWTDEQNTNPLDPRDRLRAAQPGVRRQDDPAVQVLGHSEGTSLDFSGRYAIPFLTAASCGHSFTSIGGHTHGGTSLRNYQAHRQRQGFWLRRGGGRHRIFLPQLGVRRAPGSTSCARGSRLPSRKARARRVRGRKTCAPRRLTFHTNGGRYWTFTASKPSPCNKLVRVLRALAAAVFRIPPSRAAWVS